MKLRAYKHDTVRPGEVSKHYEFHTNQLHGNSIQTNTSNCEKLGLTAENVCNIWDTAVALVFRDYKESQL